MGFFSSASLCNWFLCLFTHFSHWCCGTDDRTRCRSLSLCSFHYIDFCSKYLFIRFSSSSVSLFVFHSTLNQAFKPECKGTVDDSLSVASRFNAVEGLGLGLLACLIAPVNLHWSVWVCVREREPGRCCCGPTLHQQPGWLPQINTFCTHKLSKTL